ncbi:alpha/beta hydrolase [Oceanicella actignis]|uniref:alpha/beta hydrolase n=1 Tax=Oceanicella actignis TaxID=1189325 RepID=UPI0011E6DD22|nr:alpha/beta fold hydrolase [Oceanicella actignis]TYO88585.1 esterase/lipase [Oceanicella actignis]
MRRWLRLGAHLAAALSVAIAAALLFGPRARFDDAAAPPALPEFARLEAWLAAREAAVPGLRPGAQKEIVWANPAAPAPTPVSVVYLHGFSATKQELRPVPDLVARALGANLFFARLRGHGRDGAALAQADTRAWFEDTAEALEIGRMLGGRVLVIATSTGGTLAAMAALRPDWMTRVGGIVLVSPNFRVRAAGADLLTLPFADPVLRLVAGDEIVSEPLSEGHARWWTLRYPFEALLPMAALVKAARAADYARARTPALFIWSPEDRVVDPAETERVFAAWGGPKVAHKVAPGPGDDPNRHVLAGALRSPGMTVPVAQRIIGWAWGVLTL